VHLAVGSDQQALYNPGVDAPLQPIPIPSLFVTGTDTGVGKTLLAEAVVDYLESRVCLSPAGAGQALSAAAPARQATAIEVPKFARLSHAGTLVVRGTAGPDRITLTYADENAAQVGYPTCLDVTLNEFINRFPRADVRRVVDRPGPATDATKQAPAGGCGTRCGGQ
jgi:hypothetical protein